ncbi:MAG: sugar kinase [Armatimonadota bacterium]|nr:sugar kinase [Armatimonadota bacterium]
MVTLGETMLRLSAPPGVALESAPYLMVHVAGAESNVAIALSRLNTSTGWISRLVDNPLGRRIHNEVRSHGVDVSRVLWTRGERVGTYFVELGRPPRSGRVIYDRTGSAMTTIDPEEVDWTYVRSARVVHLTGITPGLSPSCLELVMRALQEARAGGAIVSFDVNYRTRLWTPADAAAILAPLVRQVGILICTADDARRVFEIASDVAETAQALRDRFQADVTVVTSGGRFAAADASRTYEREGYLVDPLDRIGAGDAFAAGFIHGFLTDGVEQGLTVGAALAALKHTFYGDTAWVSAEDIQTLVTGEEMWR